VKKAWRAPQSNEALHVFLGLPVCQQRKISNDFNMPFTLSHKMVWKIRGCGSFIRKRCQVIKMFSLVIFSSNISYEISNK